MTQPLVSACELPGAAERGHASREADAWQALVCETARCFPPPAPGQTLALPWQMMKDVIAPASGLDIGNAPPSRMARALVVYACRLGADVGTTVDADDVDIRFTAAPAAQPPTLFDVPLAPLPAPDEADAVELELPADGADAVDEHVEAEFELELPADEADAVELELPADEADAVEEAMVVAVAEDEVALPQTDDPCAHCAAEDEAAAAMGRNKLKHSPFLYATDEGAACARHLCVVCHALPVTAPSAPTCATCPAPRCEFVLKDKTLDANDAPACLATAVYHETHLRGHWSFCAAHKCPNPTCGPTPKIRRTPGSPCEPCYRTPRREAKRMRVREPEVQTTEEDDDDEAPAPAKKRARLHR